MNINNDNANTINLNNQFLFDQPPSNVDATSSVDLFATSPTSLGSTTASIPDVVPAPVSTDLLSTFSDYSVSSGGLNDNVLQPMNNLLQPISANDNTSNMTSKPATNSTPIGSTWSNSKFTN